MYKIKYNNAVVCTPQFKKFAAIAGTLQEGLNAVSVFSFTLPPNHLYFDSIEGRNGLVKLYDDDNVLFIGDIVNRKENFDCTTEIECQDALGWLNDVVFVKPTFSGAIENYWAYLLGRYNQEASEWRKINIGTVTVQDNISVNHDTEFLTIFDLVSELTQLSGGYVSVRYEGEEIFLDYLAQANTESDQSILFGTNLINLEDFVSEEQIFSRIYPRGKDGLDISSVNDGLTYLTNGITESMFGIVAVTVDFDTESATELKTLGQAYLEANGLASRTLTLTAFDLSLVDKNYTEIKVGNIVPVISPLHGINTKMQVNAKTTDIVTPENSTFTLGLILNTISGIMASGGTSSKTISGQVTPPTEITGAVRYDITQTLSDAEKARARANIGAGIGSDGATFIPSVSADGTLSWTNNKGLTNPEPVNIKGEDGAFRINVTYSNGVYSADKTFDEIKAAYDAGQQPYVVETGSTLDLVYTLANFDALTDGSEPKSVDFKRYLVGDGILKTEMLRVYSYTTDSGSNVVKRIDEFKMPTSLKNPNALTFTGGATGSYDGSEPETVHIPVIPYKVINENTAARHSHDNKTVLDGITAEKVTEWDSKNSITDSGGYFTSDTVEGALQEIGAELAGINTLLGSGIQISFTIDDGGSNSETFSVVSGTTWAEWIGTGRLIFNDSLVLYIYGGVVATEAGVYAVSLDGSTAVSGGDEIISGATYTIINWGG